MESSEAGRPSKRPRVDATENPIGSKDEPKARSRRGAYKRQQRRAELDHPQPESSEHRRDRELFGIDEDNENEIGLKPLQDEENAKLKRLHFPKLFSQPSVMETGDKGIFVTCDKGREKKCLTELADLVDDYIEKHELVPAELFDANALLESRLERQQKKSATVAVDGEESPVEEEEIDVESSINAEISAMKSPRGGDSGSQPAKDSLVKVKAFQLITLDVPCVSFLRFIPGGTVFAKLDVVDLVHSICEEAARNPGRLRSRYIKRLSPVVWLGKVLSGGLERACEKVLPAHFKLGAESEPEENNAVPDSRRAVTFAIRPTIRNNDKVPRDEVIREVAEAVQSLGNRQHKVDLKGYEKGVLVEIYRGWVGMSVVNNLSTKEDDETPRQEGYGIGYEALKRFNLAEIYAEGLSKGKDESRVKVKSAA